MLNLIQTNEYQCDTVCSICQEVLTNKDQILLIKHWDATTQKADTITVTRQKKHIFHYHCLLKHFELNDAWCPLDRQQISRVYEVRLHHVASLNLLHFAQNYYQLIDQIMDHPITISFIDSVNLNYKDSNGKTLFYCACQRGHLSLVKQLVKLGSITTITDNYGFTPLMAAVTHNYLPLVRYLLSLPSIISTINHVDYHGKNAMHYAMECNHLKCINLLMQIPTLDHRILHLVLTHYQSIKPNHPNYSQIIKLRVILRHLLGLPKISDIILKQCKIMLKQPIHYTPTPVKSVQSERILNIDIVRSPEWLDLIYQPQE